jgi:DNA-directed RNA polymerase specialized sigma24 family protein
MGMFHGTSLRRYGFAPPKDAAHPALTGLFCIRRVHTPILPDELAAQSQLGVRGGLAINKLPERVRLVMLMVYEDGISHREAANRLGITEGRLNQLHGDAIRRMRCEIVRQLGSHTLAHRKGE